MSKSNQYNFNMQKARFLLGIGFCLSSLAGNTFGQTSDDRPIISVLDFQASGISRAEVQVFVDYVSSHIVKTGKYIVIDRMKREEMLKEIEFSYSDCTDEGCQLEIGKQLAANQIMVGSIGQVGGRFILNIRLIKVETGEALNTASEIYRTLEELLDDSRRLTYAFLGVDDSSPPEPSRPARPSRKPESEMTPQPETRITTQPEPVVRVGRWGLSLDLSVGYGFFPEVEEGDNGGLSISTGLLYQFGNWFSLGMVLHYGNYEFTYPADAGASSTTAADAVQISFWDIGIKLGLGNKIDNFAIHPMLGISIPHIEDDAGNVSFFAGGSLYLSNFMISFFYSLDAPALAFEIGYSLYFGE